MCLPAAIALVSAALRADVTCASKYTSASGSASAWSMSSNTRVRPCRAAIGRSLSAFRPSRIGSGTIRSSPTCDTTGVAQGEDRADQMLAVAHPAADAVHDHADRPRPHALPFVTGRQPPPGLENAFQRIGRSGR